MTNEERDTIEIRINALIAGDIWMPCVRAEKQVEAKYTLGGGPWREKWTTLREALVRICNDGDFRGCSIVCALITVEYEQGSYAGRRTRQVCTVSRFWHVLPTKTIADLFEKEVGL